MNAIIERLKFTDLKNLSNILKKWELKTEKLELENITIGEPGIQSSEC